jgi:tripartite-type tricarboxylate transporter receptor subunit TctC
MSERCLGFAHVTTAIVGVTTTAILATAPAQAFPERAVRLVVPNAPGSSGDIVARIVAPPLSTRLGQAVVVENRAGAGTVIGTEAVAKAPSDGHTLLLGLSTLAINPAMYRKLPFDALTDLAPVAQLVSVPALLIAHPSVPAKDVKELIALARSRPGSVVFGSTGHGSFSHVATELFASSAGLRMLHVPYKGTSPALAALITGEVALMTSNLLSALPHAKANRVHALAITSAKRSASAPDVPTLAEAGVPGYEAVQWMGVLAPAGAPSEVITRLYNDVAGAMRSPGIQERLERDGAEAVIRNPAEFGAYIRAETAKWKRALSVAGIRPE